MTTDGKQLTSRSIFRSQDMTKALTEASDEELVALAMEFDHEESVGGDVAGHDWNRLNIRRRLMFLLLRKLAERLMRHLVVKGGD